MSGISFWAYLASLPVEASDLGAAGFVSLGGEFESDAGADEDLFPFPLAGVAADFLA
jgi:hypothetical protein